MELTDKLTALSHGIDSLMRTIFLRDREATLRAATEKIHALLNAESCAIFLVSDREPASLELVSSYTDLKQSAFSPLRLKIHSQPGKGLTGYLASLPGSVILNLSGNALQQHPHKGRKRPTHLASGECYSWLSVPLRDRKDRLLGMLKVENKKILGGQASSGVVFDPEDEAVAKIAANMILIVVEYLHTANILRGLLRNMRNSRDLEQILEEVLSDGTALLAADRADLVLWSETQQKLIVVASQGDIPLEKGTLATCPSLISSLWSSEKEYDLVPDVQARSDYLLVDSRTKTELSIVLQIDGHRIGVLNMEAFRHHGFDEEDVTLLQLLAQYAAIGVQMVGKERYIQEISERLAIPERAEVFQNILSSVKEIYGFEAGLIYRADIKERKLYLAAYIGCDNVPVELEAYHHAFDATSLTTHVYHSHEPLFVESMPTDPRVDKKSAAAFDIPGAAVGVPLLFQQECVGVLVIWSRKRNHVTSTHTAQLRPFASLAAANIAMAASEQQRTAGLKAVQAILTHMQTELPKEQYLRLILEGIRIAGFDRVRHFHFEEEERCFVGVDSLGMTDPQRFQGHQIFLDANPYARDTAETAFKDPTARLYTPARFGPDPDAARLEKSPEATWAAAVLVVQGRLYGQITADNEIHRHPISVDSLEHLSLLTALASQAIASSAMFDELRARNLQERFIADVLHDIKSPVHSISNIAHVMLSNECASTEDYRGWLQALRQEADSLSRLVKQAPDLIHRRQRIYVMKPMSLRQMVEETVKVFRLAAQKRDLRVALTLPTTCCELDADVEQLRVAFDNVLDNAQKYSPVGATIEVTLEDPGTGFYLLYVSDSGPGVPEAERTEIFDPFVSITRAGRTESSGLGLSISQTILQAHGGTLDYEDRSDRQGACFVFRFPTVSSGLHEIRRENP